MEIFGRRGRSSRTGGTTGATIVVRLGARWLAVSALALALAITPLADSAAEQFELWAVDQADAAKGGDTLYVYASDSWAEPREVINLGGRAAAVGDGPGIRPHLLLFNNAHTHAPLANVASGHVYVIRAADRTIVASIDVGDQAHGAMASPDDRWILVANQNGKRLARIEADFVEERFVYDPAADLDLQALEDDDHPDNAPICPVMYVAAAGKAYVTLRGGGMYFVDTLATPMTVTRTYSKDQVPPAGCGGAVAGNRIYVNSGSATDGQLHLFDGATDDLIGSMPTTRYGTDAHGMALVGDRYLWMTNRGDGDNIVIADGRTFEVVSAIPDVGPAPGLLHVSPGGDHVFVTLRGPKALTGGPSAAGSTPGIAILAVERGGAGGRRVGFIPVGSQEPDSPADPHAIAVRRLPAAALR